MTRFSQPFPPGPRSRIPGRVFRELRADPLAFLVQNGQRFGDIFSFSAFGQRYVVVNHPDLVREVLLTQADAFWKGPALQNSKGTLGEGLLTAEGEAHRQQRRLMTPAFHARQVETYADEVTRCTGMLVEQWRRDAGQEAVDIRRAMMRLTLLVAGRALFGALLEEETELVRRSMEDLLGNFRRAVVPWGKLLMKLPLASTRRILRAQRELRGLIERVIAERRSGEGGRPPGERGQRRDLLSTLLAASDPESASPVRLTDKQLGDQAITILTAGHETTANAMTFTLWLLAKHPQEQERLRREIIAAAGDGDATMEMIERVPLVRRVLSESMRLFPPAWTLGRQNQREVVIGGYRLPPKCTVLAPQWVLHRDGRWWAEPLAFRPDRWKEPAHPRYAYFPFSTGPRNCIGEAFAWVEMSLALALLVRAFAFSLPPGAPAELRLMPSITLRPHGRVLLRMRQIDSVDS